MSSNEELDVPEVQLPPEDEPRSSTDEPQFESLKHGSETRGRSGSGPERVLVDVEYESDDVDEEVFEIIDYTAASSWERFITSIEQCLTNWHVSDASLGMFDPKRLTKDKPFYQKKETIHLGDVAYYLTYHCISNPGGRSENGVWSAKVEDGNDFVGPSPVHNNRIPHPLHRQTGFSHLITLAPALDSTKKDSHFDVSTAKLLVSSLAMACQNTCCTIPCFAPSSAGWKGTWLGTMLANSCGLGPIADDEGWVRQGHVAEVGDVEIRFRTWHNSWVPSMYKNLSGMMQFFMLRSGIPDGTGRRHQITVAANITFVLPNPGNLDWLVDDHSPRPLPPLPLGTFTNPLAYLQLECIFPPQPPDFYYPHEQLDPLDSPTWVLSKSWRGEEAVRGGQLLQTCIDEWLDAHRQRMAELIDQNQPSRGEAKRPPSRLGAVVDAVVQAGENIIEENAPGTFTGQKSIVDFDDVHDTLAELFAWDNYNHRLSRWQPETPNLAIHRLQPHRIPHVFNLAAKMASHAVPPDGLLWHFAHRLMDCLSSTTSLRFRHTSLVSFTRAVWAEFLECIEECWAQDVYIPGVNWPGDDGDLSKPSIDLRYTLLHQKLSMLNVCIFMKRQKDKLKDSGRTGSDDLVRTPVTESPQHSPVWNPGGLSAQPPPGGWMEDPNLGKRVVKRLGRQAQAAKKLLGLDIEPEQQKPSALVRLFDKISDDSELPNVQVTPGTLKGSILPSNSDMWSLPRTDSDPVPPGDRMLADSVLADDSIPPRSDPVPVSKVNYHWTDDEGEQFFDSSQSPQHRERISSVASHESMVSPVSSSLDAGGSSYKSDFIRIEKTPSMAREGPSLLVNEEEEEEDVPELPPGEFSGRVRPLESNGEPLLLLSSQEPLWEPVLQETGFVTEDMLRAQASKLENLGHGPSAAKQRAKLQSAQLFSDMQAFKAANPQATLEDFVRWHSPRDWIADDAQGHLSGRMLEPGNLWNQLWKSAKRIPADHQKPLFDYETEARTVFEQLSQMTPYDILTELLPTMFLITYDNMSSLQDAAFLPAVTDVLYDLGNALASFDWWNLEAGLSSSRGQALDPSLQPELDIDVPAWGEQVIQMFSPLMQKLCHAEVVLSQALSLLGKAPDQYRLVQQLLVNQETVVSKTERPIIYESCLDGPAEKQRFPSSKEYVFRALAPRPHRVSRPTMQRMYFLQTDHEFRVIESLSKDTVLDAW